MKMMAGVILLMSGGRKFFVSFLAEPSCQSRFILTSQDLPTKFETAECDRYKNLWYCQLLKGLEVPEQVALFQKAELDGDWELPHSPLRVIGEVYDGHPLALRTIAGEIKGVLWWESQGLLER
jgi:hypothetical protein